MSLTLSSATPEVRTVPTCSDISETAHDLLVHLTRTRAGNKGTPRVRGDLDSWARDLKIDRETLHEAFKSIGPDGDAFVQRDQFGRLVLWLPCACGAARKTDLSRKGSKEARRKPTARRGASSTGSASMILSASRVNNKFLDQDETPGQTAETFWLNGASADDEVAPTDNPVTLASHFVGKVCSSASRQGVRVLPGSIKQAALRHHFKTILEGGVDTEIVRSMIDSFAANYRRYHKPGADPGVVFLAHRRRLYDQAAKRATLATERDIDRLSKPTNTSTIDDILGR